MEVPSSSSILSTPSPLTFFEDRAISAGSLSDVVVWYLFIEKSDFWYRLPWWPRSLSGLAAKLGFAVVEVWSSNVVESDLWLF